MSLTEQQRKYAEARMEGLSIKDSALAAGCPVKTAAQAGSRLERHPGVLGYLARLKALESDTNPAAGRDTSPPGGAGVDGSFFDDPKDMLKYAMNDRKLSVKERMQAAIALLPFEHQKLGEGGKKERKEAAAHDAGKGRFAPNKPPSTQLSLVR
jgi:phage terminase small subunit